ncbi:MAG: thrombospondin type 3 repeat-containing protein, partial [Acidobacteriota bacterium]
VDSCAPGLPTAESCNGVDDDCDGLTDDNIAPVPTTCGVGACRATGESTCQDGVMVDSCAPGLPTAESCNGVDDDCDGAVDDGIAPVPTTCGVGACASTGALTCVGGALQDSCVAGTPGTETCNGIDDNCNGAVDEGLSCGADSDDDGVPDALDNCPSVPNPGQLNTGGDPTKGNACDVPTNKDECKANGWRTFTSAGFRNQGQCVAFVERADRVRGRDGDRDGIPDTSDNCPAIANSSQLDSDNNGRGNACDVPKSRNECSNNLWRSFTLAGFRNQNQCVAFVNLVSWFNARF